MGYEYDTAKLLPRTILTISASKLSHSFTVSMHSSFYLLICIHTAKVVGVRHDGATELNCLESSKMCPKVIAFLLCYDSGLEKVS